MALYKFDDNDVFINKMIAYPEFNFVIYYDNSAVEAEDPYVKSKVIINSSPSVSGSNNANVTHVDENFLSLYESNINRPSGSVGIKFLDTGNSNPTDNPDLYNDAGEPRIVGVRHSESDPTGSLIRKFLTRDGPKNAFKQTETDYNVLFDPGDTIISNNNLSASIFIEHYQQNSARPFVAGLKNSLNHYSYLSPHYQFNSTMFGDKATQEICFINIPSIFYGKGIKKGSVVLNYYITGTLVATAKDQGKNGQMIQTGPYASNGSGSTVGVVLYKEGCILLNATHQIGNNNSIKYSGSATAGVNKWTHFGSAAHRTFSPETYTNIGSASFSIDYQGETSTTTMLMMAHAKYGELNYSNNPTFVDKSGNSYRAFISSSNTYKETPDTIKNVTDTNLVDFTPKQKKETYISKVAIYDDDRNLIGIAKLATPVRKTEDRQYIFKLKLDI